ncbi:MAG: hypothetical protein PUG92_06625 [Fibrobacter intestinalis]|nr:hypothetical protein [Fibrobacter intestinalis]
MNWEFGETVASSFFVRDGIRQNDERRELEVGSWELGVDFGAGKI